MSKRNPIETVTQSTDLYVAFDPKNKAIASGFSATSAAKGIERTSAGRRNFSNLASNISARPGLTNDDYDYFRPEEAICVGSKDAFVEADKFYENVGLVKNVIDLMGDFTSQGIRLAHKNKKVERWYQYWFNSIVNGPFVSERFCNQLYRLGAVPVQMQTAKLKQSDIERASAALDFDGLLEGYKPEKKEIPVKYVFHHPYFISILGGQVASFANKIGYAVQIPESLRQQIKNPSEADREIVSSLPAYILQAAESRTPYPLPQGKVFLYQYKKDDWRQWARPMIYSIMDDLVMLEKLKLADKCALDGATSHLRIFKLGYFNKDNPNLSVAATAAAFNRLSSILQNNVGGGNIDIVWDPLIELEETKSDAYNFLGEEKYKPCLQNIYSGLGIPPTLTGTFGAAGTTNNFVSLKTLTERLEYGRNILIAFWNAQLKMVQRAMGHRFAAIIEFDKPVLANEDMEKKILLDMRDRGLISDELVQRRMGIDPGMEKIRTTREERERQSGQRIHKGTPYPDPTIELAKVALTTGQATPSQVGLILEDKSPSEKKVMDIKPLPGAGSSKKPKKLAGRPKLSKDKSKRKTKTVRPRTKASATLELWAKEAQRAIADLVNPLLLEQYNKKNIRSLTEKEYQQADALKFGVLSNMVPYMELSQESIGGLLPANISDDIFTELDECKAAYVKAMKKEPTVEETREMQVKIVANRWLYKKIEGDTSNGEG